MIGFKEYLTESRMGSVFHATTPFNAENIIQKNMFQGKPSHDLPGNKKHKAPLGAWNRSVGTYGVSFSRNMRAASNFAFHDKNLNVVVIFEIDQQKLTAQNKIQPVSYIGRADSGTRFLNVARTPRDNHRETSGEFFFANEYEEYVLGDIRNVDKMIIKIHVMSELTEEHIKQKFPLLWEHPKLYNSKNRFEKGNFYNN